MSIGSDRSVLHDGARALYVALVAQARRSEFYTVCGVPDSVDGRFDLIALHTYLVLHRLKTPEVDDGDDSVRVSARALAQALFDLFCVDMDRNLREMGVGDLGVGKRVKAMVQGLYGRIAAYDSGFAADDGNHALHEALRRNLYGTVGDVDLPGEPVLDAVADYLRRSTAALRRSSMADLIAGKPDFVDPPRG